MDVNYIIHGKQERDALKKKPKECSKRSGEDPLQQKAVVLTCVERQHAWTKETGRMFVKIKKISDLILKNYVPLPPFISFFILRMLFVFYIILLDFNGKKFFHYPDASQRDCEETKWLWKYILPVMRWASDESMQKLSNKKNLMKYYHYKCIIIILLDHLYITVIYYLWMIYLYQHYYLIVQNSESLQL